MTKHLVPAAYIFPRSVRLYHGFLRQVRSTRNYGTADSAASGCCSGCSYCCYYCCYCSGPGRACFVVLASWAPIYRHCSESASGARSQKPVRFRFIYGAFDQFPNRRIPPRFLDHHPVQFLPEQTISSLKGRLSYRDRSSPNMKRYVRDPHFRK